MDVRSCGAPSCLLPWLVHRNRYSFIHLGLFDNINLRLKAHVRPLQDIHKVFVNKKSY